MIIVKTIGRSDPRRRAVWEMSMLQIQLSIRPIAILTVCLLFCASLACTEEVMTPEQAKKVLSDFYADRVPEEIQDRLLVDAGKPIAPYLLVEIKNKDMPKRRYAILALGKIKDKRALPVLTQILDDSSEINYFRDDALCAIWHIDRKLGEQSANQYSGKIEGIDRIIQLLREGVI